MRPSTYPQGVLLGNRGAYSSSLGLYQSSRVDFVERNLVIRINFADGTGTNTTPITLPAGAIVFPYPIVNIRTAEATGATKTFSVGITGTAAAFINGMSSASTGVFIPALTFGAVTMGTSLFQYSGTGSTAPVPSQYIASAAIAVTWTPGSTDWANFDADLIIPVLIKADFATNIPLNVNLNNLDYGASA